MSQLNQARRRFGGRSRGGLRDGGRGGKRMLCWKIPGCADLSLPPDDEENFMFDIFYYSNRVETVNIVNAQRKLCDYVATRHPNVSKIFSHRVVVSFDIAEAPEFQCGEDHNSFLHDQYCERVMMLMKREDNFKFNI